MSVFNGNRQNGNGVSDAELRAVERSVLGGRRVLWAGLAAVLLPLSVLLALQYWWLTELEQNSAIARKATLDNYLETITKEVHYFYYKISERYLNLPAEIFTEEKIGKSASWFKKKEIPGARQLFVVSYKTKDALRFYNPDTGKMEVPDFSDETVAVWAAASPWSYLRKKDTKIKTTSLTADQHDPNNRIILNPITDEDWKLVGLAGLIIDEKHFKKQVLPDAIKSSLPKFEDEDKEKLRVVVRDGSKHQVLPQGEKALTDNDRARRGFQFVFTDWTIARQFHLQHDPVGRPRGGPAGGHRPDHPHRVARDETLGDEKRVRFERVARTPHAAFLDPRLRRIHAPRPRGGPGKGPRVRVLHRNREQAPHPADQQYPRLFAHRVGTHRLYIRTDRPGRTARRHPGPGSHRGPPRRGRRRAF